MDAPSVAAGRTGQTDPIFWVALGDRRSCPVCGSDGPKDGIADGVLRDARTAFLSGARMQLAYLRCSACGTVFAPEGESLRYEDDDGNEDALRHYVEEGAGIDLLIEPLCRLNRADVQHYAEIGCAFGFSLDFARRSLGWDVRGIDPSPLAAAGRDALGLPIQLRYFTEHHPLSAPRADVLQVAEVIEHIADPHAFMRALVASLDENGVLIISTPNAAALNPATSDELLLQVMQPGIHLRLFTVRSLVALAEAHGFLHCQVHETMDDLTLYAARHAFALRDPANVGRTDYLDYLRRRLADTPHSGPLRRGLQSRLLRELTMQGRFPEMDAVLPQVFSEYQACQVDLSNPSALTPSARSPHNVAALLYCLGMRQLIGRADLAGALRYFDACLGWHGQVAAWRAVAGVADASATTLAQLAAEHAADARTEIDPQAEHDRLISTAELRLLSLDRRQRLFSALVNRGDYLRAALHHDEILASTGYSGERITQNKNSIDQRVMTCFTLGIFALNHLGDRPAARHWLVLAVDLADGATENEAVRHQAVIALHRAADSLQPQEDNHSPHIGAKSPKRGLVRRLLDRVGGRPAITFAQLSETPNEALLPPLDQAVVDESTLTPEQRAWRRDGLLILRKFVPASVTDPYIARRAMLENPGGWLSPAPYLQVPELRTLSLYPPLMHMLEHLISEPMLLHLALTGWISTERNWHQDDYLNPPFVNSWYCAVWIALGHIDPASGPFEYVPGSHRWPLLRGEKVRGFLTEEELNRQEFGVNHWPKYSERFVAPAIEAEIARHGLAPRTFLAEKGDVLIWHGRLMHRGSVAADRGRERRSLITHYSGINHRLDMPARQADGNGHMYAMFDIPLH